MSAFKDQIRADISNVFINIDEFGAEHTVNGKIMPIIVDSNELEERQKKAKSNMDGVFTRATMIYVKAKDFGGRMPSVGSALQLDGQTYLVTYAINEDGIYSIELEAARA